MTPARLRTATAVALEGVALNDAQHRALYDPSPECDSLAERIVSLREHNVPAPVVRDLLGEIRNVIQLNAREGGCHRQVAGQLDQLARALDGGDKIADALTVRGLVRHLRPALSTLLSPQQTPAAELVEARGVVRRLISTTPVERLASATLRHELGGRKHRKLMELVGEGSR